MALTLALVLAMTVGFASNPGTASSSPGPRMWASGFNSEGKLTDVYIELTLLEASLAEHMADGSMTGEDFAFYLDKAKAASQDGVALRWTFAEDSGLFVDKDSNGPGTVYYLDGNGNKVFVDPATMLSMFVFAPDTAVEADDSTGAEPQIGVFAVYEDPENGTGTVKLNYDAEKGVWINPETGEEYALCIDAEAYLDTGAIIRQQAEN